MLRFTHGGLRIESDCSTGEAACSGMQPYCTPVVARQSLAEPNGQCLPCVPEDCTRPSANLPEKRLSMQKSANLPEGA
eukprot:5444512-Alexandrium_andersonii.AAC.1